MGDRYAIPLSLAMPRQPRMAGEEGSNPRRPYAKNGRIVLNSQAYRIADGVMRIPILAGQCIYIKLTPIPHNT